MPDPHVVVAGSEDGDSLVIQPGYPRKIRDDQGNWALEYLYWCNTDQAYSLAPAHNATPPSPEGATFTALKCKRVEIRELGETPGVSLMTVRYETPTASSVSTGDVFQGAVASVREKPIAEHPTLGEGQASESTGKALMAKGVTHYRLPTVVYTRREIKSSFTFSETNVKSGVGALSSPTGLSSPTANFWLKTGFEIQETEDGYEQTESWEYSGDAAWDTDVY